MPYISVNHSLKIDLSAHNFSEPFTENSFYGPRCSASVPSWDWDRDTVNL